MGLRLDIKYKKFEIIEILMKRTTGILLIIIFLVQSYIYFSNTNSILLLNRFHNNTNLIVKNIDLVPQYGELIIKTNEQIKDDPIITINGQKQSFDQGTLKLFVKEGDCIEIKGSLLNKDHTIYIEDSSMNIKNIDKENIRITNKYNELFVINLE